MESVKETLASIYNNDLDITIQDLNGKHPIEEKFNFWTIYTSIFYFYIIITYITFFII